MPCLKAGFVNWDDDIHVLHNFILQAPIRWGEIWTTTLNGIYIPLTATTWALEHYCFGFNPLVFHLDNVFLHLLVTALIFVFSKRMGLSFFASSLAALLFGIHPIHVESVAWASERKDVLYGAFYMAALLAYLRYLDTGGRKYFWLTGLLGILSICAKPMAVSLVLVLVLLDWFFGRPWTLQAIAEKFIVGMVLIYIAGISYALNTGLVVPSAGQGPLIWSWCFMQYLCKFFFPWPLMVCYGFPRSLAMLYWNALAFGGLCIMLLVLRHSRLLVFAVVFYAVNILFVLKYHSNLIWISDRYMYVPSVGLCMLAAACVERILSFVQGRRLFFYGFCAALCVTVAGLTVLTQRQCGVWQNSITLWSHQLKYGPKLAHWLVYDKLADAYAAENQHINPGSIKSSRIAAFYAKSMQLKPDFIDPYFGLGNFLESAGDVSGAEHYYQRALSIDPHFFKAYYNLGRIYQKKNLPGQAINFYREALSLNPFLCRDILAAYKDAIQKQQDTLLYQKEKLKMPACP